MLPTAMNKHEKMSKLKGNCLLEPVVDQAQNKRLGTSNVLHIEQIMPTRLGGGGQRRVRGSSIALDRMAHFNRYTVGTLGAFHSLARLTGSSKHVRHGSNSCYAIYGTEYNPTAYATRVS